MQNLKIKIKSGNAKFKNGKHKTGHFTFFPPKDGCAYGANCHFDF